ncbi:carboxypeptidase-like regulatory domain-containing protein [Hymenobacter arizonensis]|uniref:CarboxypepD_reg-like domain-containing protein n=1 Tax=Hymenobacter arizonensis TaxID=1227077 RepID=A0A1I6AFG5_HYMAR|nr:carboxypeptidase-like regulatory domain-containing protein [Hymenobacter arizonensis]SFQ67405.1 CarboxypepD_reg-like domain-containing protein [Hymenobacter arizonensis]
MFRCTFSLLFLLCLSCTLSAQAQLLAGRVVAEGSGVPVAFATIGVKGKPVGTTADASGSFSFQAPATVSATDSVIISCIGYRALRLTIAALSKPAAVWPLQPAKQALQEVQVRHRQVTPAIIGRNSKGGTARWSTSIRDVTSVASDERGWEVSTILPIRQSCYLDAFSVYIEQNGFQRIRLRFTLYAVEGGKPTKSLLTNDIQFTIPSQQTGWSSVDLSPYNLHLPKGQTVAVGVQWLQGEKLPEATQAFGGPGAFPSVAHRVAVRNKSEDEWRVLPINVSMYLNVQQYKE